MFSTSSCGLPLEQLSAFCEENYSNAVFICSLSSIFLLLSNLIFKDIKKELDITQKITMHPKFVSFILIQVFQKFSMCCPVAVDARMEDLVNSTVRLLLFAGNTIANLVLLGPVSIRWQLQCSHTPSLL